MRYVRTHRTAWVISGLLAITVLVVELSDGSLDLQKLAREAAIGLAGGLLAYGWVIRRAAPYERVLTALLAEYENANCSVILAERERRLHDGERRDAA